MSEPLPFQHLIDEARKGLPEALGNLLEECRPFLELMAREALTEDLQAKVGASDLVQHTLLQAVNHFDQFKGNRKEDMLNWLRLILHNQMLHTSRMFCTDKRDLGRELPLESWLMRELKDSGPSPSALVRRDEKISLIREAIQKLPNNYQEILIWHHLEGKTFVEIGQRLGRSPDAIRMLWTRSLVYLGSLCESVQ